LLPISYVFKAAWNTEPDRLGYYRLCAATKSSEKVLLLDVEGQVPLSWRRQCFDLYQ